MSSNFERAVLETLSGDGVPVNINRFKHVDIVRGLHALYHEFPNVRGAVRITHNDGSESAPLPLTSFTGEVVWDERERPLRIGFLSGRHLELDRFIDFYLLRNREIEQFDTSAEKEQEVFERARTLFIDAARAGFSQIESFHTGLPLVTLGFYRAAATLAIEKGLASPLLLRPHIWSPRDVEASRLARKTGADLDAVAEQLENMASSLSQFLRVERREKQFLSLRWILNRPMLTSEKDWLLRLPAREKPIVRAVVNALFERTQYEREKVWQIV